MSARVFIDVAYGAGGAQWLSRCNDEIQDQSGGQYLQTYIPAHGTIITNSVISPQANIYSALEQMGQPRPTPQELRRMIPRMNRWSDIVWFLWAKKTGEFADDLRYIVKDNIVNKPTRSVIDQVFGIPPNTLELKWPGKTFDVRNSDQGKALLGSPLGSGLRGWWRIIRRFLGIGR